MTDQAELFSTRMAGRALEVRSPRDWMARWSCDQWQLGVTGQKRENTSCGSGSRYGSSRDTSGGFFMSQQPHGSPGGSLVPTHWLNNAGKLSLLTGLFHNLRKRRKRRESSWGRDTPHSLPLGLLLTLTFRHLSPAGS